MRTKFDGVCFRCHQPVKAGHGDFQHIASLPYEVKKNYFGKPFSFVVRCFACKGKGNVPLKANLAACHE